MEMGMALVLHPYLEKSIVEKTSGGILKGDIAR